MENSQLSLSIRNVSKAYLKGPALFGRSAGVVQALNTISLHIPAVLYGLLGPKGAGKSTIMRILATLQEPDDGSIQLGQIDVSILVHIYSSQEPGEGFELVEPELEDVYFSTMTGFYSGSQKGEVVA